MKKLLLSLSIACMTIGAWGAKAYHLPVTVTQSDGQPLTIIQFGDEDMNYVTTTDGVLLYQEGTTYYIATVDEYGELVNTSVLAHNAGADLEPVIIILLPAPAAGIMATAASGWCDAMSAHDGLEVGRCDIAAGICKTRTQVLGEVLKGLDGLIEGINGIGRRRRFEPIIYQFGNRRHLNVFKQFRTDEPADQPP